MASQKNSPPIPTPTKIEPEIELPILTFVSLHRTDRGWVVPIIKVQGRVVLSEELAADKPMSREAAINLLKVEFTKRFIAPEAFKALTRQ